MGCSQSRLDDEEAVQLCKDRKGFIKQAVEQRARFASEHIAYFQSLQKVSAALRVYVEGYDDDQPHEFLDPFIKTFTPTTMEYEPGSVIMKVNYLRPSGNPVVSVEERVQSPEMIQVEEYPPMEHFGIDGFFAMDSSFFSCNSPDNRPTLPPPSPQAFQWDSYWNPFSPLDYYNYPIRSSLDQVAIDDETRGEEEGIPDLEEDETVQENFIGEERAEVSKNSSMEVMVGDVDVHDDEVENSEEAHGNARFAMSKAQTAGHVESSCKEMAIGDQDGNGETPGVTVYVDRRPTSMGEVITDLEAQFKVVRNAANEVSEMLQAKKIQHLVTSNDLSGKLLNPIALFRSASSCSSSNRDRDKGYDSSNDLPEDHSKFSGSSHQATLERLYEWEKKLYEEVRSGERVRIAYEKKCMLFRDQDVKGEDPSSVDKTRAAIRDLHTQITVSMHSVEAISKRIETLRDEELHPQLLQLVKGLARMWKVMAESHHTQKIILDEAKILLPRKQSSSLTLPDPQRVARSASSLETELKNWRSSFESWIVSQRSYVHALTGWLLRCVRSEPDDASPPRHRSSTTHPIFGLCVQWSKHLDAIHETSVLEGIDFFAAGIGSLCAQEVREDSRGNTVKLKESGGNMEETEVVKVEEEEVVMGEDDGIRVLCDGMRVAMSSLAEFAKDHSEGYDEVVKLWENEKWELKAFDLTSP
ncbi:nitrate regulatory gene2 protein-like [Senna tora]|uniref:Nitrate regulatory gene2 protein-like n=1 Tax=Senna tora TaxID=362788 RepID=A0A834SPP9_9FABA|nr:nitrate regulatory gene2 protein-like [Senna tora]